MNGRTLFDLIGTVDEQMLEHSEWTAPKKGGKFKVKKALVLAAAVIAALAVTVTAAAVSGGVNILSWISDAFPHGGWEYVPDQGVLQAQLDEGQWAYLNGENIAVILPQSPVKILLSGDGGKTWKESVVLGSDKMEFWGELCNDVQYYGGFIGFFGESGGYLVLTAEVRMNNQPMRIYLTGDGGNTWSEIGGPYSGDYHRSVLTGAGFSTPEIGFISYRYYEDFGPDIWWTADGGDSWQKLPVTVPEQYAGRGLTPLTPTFDGKEGVYPIAVNGETMPNETTIYLYSHDYGLTWEFE